EPEPTSEEARGRITVWDTAEMKQLCTFDRAWPVGNVRVVGFASDGQALALEGSWMKSEAGATHTLCRLGQGRWGRWLDESEVKLFDSATGQECGTLEGYSKIAFSPDGHTLAANGGPDDFTIRLFVTPLRKPWGFIFALWGLAALPWF